MYIYIYISKARVILVSWRAHGRTSEALQKPWQASLSDDRERRNGELLTAYILTWRTKH